MLSAITIGLSLISKLTAMIYVASYLLYLSVEMVRLKQWRKDAAKITIFVSIIIVIWIGSNPTLRHDPFNRSVYYFRQRVDSVMSQQKQYVEWKQKSLVEKTAVSYLKIFPMTRSYPDFLLSAIRVGFYLLGVWYSFRKAVKGSTKHLFIILFSLSSSYLLLVTLYLPWNRYLLPLVVFALLFQVIGWNAVYEWAIKKMSFKS